MILAIDVYYYSEKAKAVGVIFKNWTDSEPTEIKTTYTNEIAAYEPGNFYKRELPCILHLLSTIDTKPITTIIVDSHVYIDNQGNYGLGGKLYDALGKIIPIIGVAKTSFFSNQQNTKEVYRGNSKKPLYVSAVGINLQEAASLVQHMHGEFRLPTILKLMDQETRTP